MIIRISYCNYFILFKSNIEKISNLFEVDNKTTSTCMIDFLIAIDRTKCFS